MMQVISPYIPFPNIYWWWQAMQAPGVLFDGTERFVKMGYRNRYFITGGNGRILLTVPVSGGRDQRTLMNDMQIDNTERWQVLHWRTISSVYGRAPYFEHFSVSLQQLFTQKFDTLVAFNQATVQWAKKETGILFAEHSAKAYTLYDGATDLRQALKPGIEKVALPAGESLYYQLFSERNGFYPNLSILDILFTEGPALKSILQQHSSAIQAWQIAKK